MSPRLQKRPFRLAILLLLLSLSAIVAPAQTTSFTYQGRLSDGSILANGNYDLQFTLWDASSGGTQQPQPSPVTVTRTSVTVTGGTFTVQLDFGASAFPGADRFLEIGVRPAGGGAFTILTPKQQITSTPYAIRSLSATTADNVTVNGVPGGSGNYVQNATTTQAGANFNISGNGIAGGSLSADTVNATTQYNLGATRLLSASSSGNLSVGLQAGPVNSSSSLLFLNSFFGFQAGQSTTGHNNSFFGAQAGLANTGGVSNSFFGNSAGSGNQNGIENNFFGDFAGSGNTTGSDNTFMGESAGKFNHTGGNNTIIGANANVGSGSLGNATAIGANAIVEQNNSLVLGSIAGVNGGGASVNVGIGTTTPQNTLHVKGGTTLEAGGSGGTVQFGTPGGETGMIMVGANRADIRFDGLALKLVAGLGPGLQPSTNGVAVTTAGAVGIGTTTPTERLTIKTATSSYGFIHTDGTITVGSFVGGSGNGGWYGTKSNHPLYFFTNDSSPLMTLTTAGNVGIGQTSPLAKLDIAGTLKVDQLAGGGDEQLCRTSVFHTVATCSSSLRYKQQIAPYQAGLELINRLRPISFAWKSSGARDLGLGAEDVATIEPLLVTHNDKGEVEGVKYDRLNIILINAIKQQQDQIETLRAQNASLNARLRSVERIVGKRPSSARRRH